MRMKDLELNRVRHDIRHYYEHQVPRDTRERAAQLAEAAMHYDLAMLDDARQQIAKAFQRRRFGRDGAVIQLIDRFSHALSRNADEIARHDAWREARQQSEHLAEAAIASFQRRRFGRDGAAIRMLGGVIDGVAKNAEGLTKSDAWKTARKQTQQMANARRKRRRRTMPLGVMALLGGIGLLALWMGSRLLPEGQGQS